MKSGKKKDQVPDHRGPSDRLRFCMAEAVARWRFALSKPKHHCADKSAQKHGCRDSRDNCRRTPARGRVRVNGPGYCSGGFLRKSLRSADRTRSGMVSKR